jgi:protein-arginine kinase activator protein McsA
MIVNCPVCNNGSPHTHSCGCQEQAVNIHREECFLQIPLLNRLAKAKDKLIENMHFDEAAAVRDAMFLIRKIRHEVNEGTKR